jgi:transposase/IS5 family transposase
MRGRGEGQRQMAAFVDINRRIPEAHPIRRIKAIADAQLKGLSASFDGMYSAHGRRSIPPERLLKACVLMALYSVRSERAFCERLEYDLLFQWFLDMELSEHAFDASSFAKNRVRFMGAEIAKKFFEAVVQSARDANLLSQDHFTVDGTLIEAWASLKSFRRADEKKQPPPDDPGNPSVDFHGETRSNETHTSTTDPEAKLMRKGPGKEAKLAFSAHVLMENRHGLCVETSVATATGTAERAEALKMVERAQAKGFKVKTLGADKAYDTQAFVEELRKADVVPHVAQNEHARKRSSIDGRTTRHASYRLSQRLRKRVEEVFGWGKTIGGLRKTRYKGVERSGFWVTLSLATYNLLRIARLTPNGATE